jgi:hypothetical protein
VEKAGQEETVLRTQTGGGEGAGGGGRGDGGGGHRKRGHGTSAEAAAHGSDKRAHGCGCGGSRVLGRRAKARRGDDDEQSRPGLLVVCSSVKKFDGHKKNSEANPWYFIKFGKIQENSTEMYLMSKKNRIFLKTRKSAEFAELAADNSAE